jgi:hypothetical protein
LDPDPPPATTPENGFNNHQRLRASSGNSGTGAFYSFGVNNTTDRALGDIGSNTTGDNFIGLRFTNNTGGTLVNFTLSYFGEEWRDGGAATPNAQSLTFAYKLTASGAGPALQDSGFTNVAALNFTSPVFTNTGAGAAVVGNTAGRSGPITATVTGLHWVNGTDLWLRWTDINNTGNDHGLAVDDLTFRAAVPEPASVLVWGFLASIGFVALRRLS